MDEYNTKFQGYGNTIYIHNNVIDIWLKYRQVKKEQHESFGVLIGSCSEDRAEYWVDLVTTPYEGDEGSRYAFLLQDGQHQQEVNDAFVSTHGQSVYLGTWHTHPQKNPDPSHIDIIDWRRCIARNKDRKLFFVIIGINEICLYTKSFFRFKKLKKI